MACVSIKCRPMPHMSGGRIMVWLESPRNPWHPPLEVRHFDYDPASKTYALACLADDIYTDLGKVRPMFTGFKNPTRSASSSASPTASATPVTP